MYHYNLLFTDYSNCVPLELLQDTYLSLTIIAPHWSSSYPECLSPTWDKDTQRAVVWMRLQEHHKLANRSLAKVNEHFCALCQEAEETQAESSHKLLSHDIKLNLLVVSRAEKVFKKGLPLNQRGDCDIPKRYLQDATYTTIGDNTGYFMKFKGVYFPIEFHFTHCFWYLVKYNTQKSCWESNKLPTEDYNLDIPDYHIVD